MATTAWAWFALFVYKVVRLRIFDHDLWWHLASGRTMVENGTFLRSEVFSHTMPGARWVNFEWLSQILLYLTVKHAGLQAILYGKVIFSFAILAVLIFVMRRFGARGPLLFIMSFVGFMILKPRLFERVELVTLLLLPVFVWLLAGAHDFSACQRKKIPWVLFGLMIVWCNLHGGFIYGIGVAALLVAGAYWSWSNEEVGVRKMLDRTLVLLMVGLLINPFGFNITEVFIDHLQQLFRGPSVIQEWAPLSVRANPAFWLLFCATSLALFTWLAAKAPHAKFWAPLVLVFLVWTARYVRNAALAPLIVLPFLAEFFSLSRHTGESRYPVFGPSFKNMFKTWIPAFAGMTTWLGWGVCFCLLIYTIPRLRQPIPREVLQLNRFPIGACRFVSENGIRGNMYNTYQMGGYIEWALASDKKSTEDAGRKVFMDGRYIFHPLLVEHARLDNQLFDNPQSYGWQTFLNQYGVNYAIVDYGPFTVPSKGKAPFSFSSINLMFPRSSWALVYWDDAALVFLKRNAGLKPAIEKFEYRSLWSYNLEQMNVLLGTNLLSRSEVVRELERHRSEVGFSVLRNQIEELLKGAVLKNP